MASPVRHSEQSNVLEGMSAIEARFRRLALAAIERQRQERARLCAALHDRVAQNLSGAGLQLELLRMDLENAAPHLSGRTAEIQALLESVVSQIRQFSHDLHPDVAERAGLQSALDMLAGRYRSQFPGVLRLRIDSSASVSPAAAAALEKIAGEAVENAVRHARCSRIEILVKAVRGGALEVRDDGAGFDYLRERGNPNGLGLSLMEFWAEQAGLRLAIGSGPGGTSVSAAAKE
jgi:signal transduction histidine kinase